MPDLKHVILSIALMALLSACDNKGAGTGESANDANTLEAIQQSGVLNWGSDVVGGVPYVFEDPKNPGVYIGFEMDIAEAIAKQLGVKQQLVIHAWDSLIPELQRGSYDMVMNGLEFTEDRQKIVALSQPYFVYAQQITVRNDTNDIETLEHLKGKQVATLSGSAAEDILRATEGVSVKINPEIIYSYQDLENGKVDAVLLDTPIAAAYGSPNPKLKNVGKSFAHGNYVIAFREEDQSLHEAVDKILTNMKRNGELAEIYRKWGIMNDDQATIGVQ